MPADCALVGDVGEVLEALTPRIAAPLDTAAWLDRIEAWKKECPLDFERDGKLRPQHVVQRLRARAGDGAVVVVVHFCLRLGRLRADGDARNERGPVRWRRGLAVLRFLFEVFANAHSIATAPSR